MESYPATGDSANGHTAFEQIIQEQGVDQGQNLDADSITSLKDSELPDGSHVADGNDYD